MPADESVILVNKKGLTRFPFFKPSTPPISKKKFEAKTNAL